MRTLLGVPVAWTTDVSSQNVFLPVQFPLLQAGREPTYINTLHVKKTVCHGTVIEPAKEFKAAIPRDNKSQRESRADEIGLDIAVDI